MHPPGGRIRFATSSMPLIVQAEFANRAATRQTSDADVYGMSAKRLPSASDGASRSAAQRIQAKSTIRLCLDYRSIGICWAPSDISEMHACELLENGCLDLMFAPTNADTSRVRIPS